MLKNNPYSRSDLEEESLRKFQFGACSTVVQAVHTASAALEQTSGGKLEKPIPTASQAGISVDSDEFFSVLDSGKSMTDYFKLKRDRDRGRVSDYVIIPQLQFVQSTQHPHKINLSFDSVQSVEMAKNTINMLDNQHKKVLKKPIMLKSELLKDIAGVEISLEDEEEELIRLLENLNIHSVSDKITRERQYNICFNVVGHGSPVGVGGPDSDTQLAPSELACLFDKIFEENGIDKKLKSSKFTIEFHCCNTAYVDLPSDITDKTFISTCVLKNSYIGRFYKAIREYGYNDVSVAGYRGFYTAITSSKGQAAFVQDDYYNPTFTMNSARSRYVVENDRCILPPTSILDQLRFPVTLDSRSQYCAESHEAKEAKPAATSTENRPRLGNTKRKHSS